MKYKLCVCDMDGTLLNSKDSITEENEIALRELQQRGVQVIIASGRLDIMVKSFIKQLGLKSYVISCNGALVRNVSTGEILYSKVMDKDVVKEIITYCLVSRVNFLIYTTDKVYSNKENPRASKFERLNKILEKDLQFPLAYIDIRNIESIDAVEVLKILLVCDSQEEVIMMEKKYSEYNNLTVVSSANGLLDIMASNISKGRALRKLADRLNVDLRQVIAFGDNYNDIEMLQCVGLPIAMENSVEELKLVAKQVTKSNDEDGVAYAIKHL